VLAADAEAALARLAAEEETIRREARESAGRRSGVDAKVVKADNNLNAAEKVFGELTSQLADLTAQRSRFENATREHADRIKRLAGEIAAIEQEFAASQRGAVKGTLSEAEAAAVAAEAAHHAARAELEAARAALAESEKRAETLVRVIRYIVSAAVVVVAVLDANLAEKLNF